MIELIDFDKDQAAQDLLGCAGITEPLLQHFFPVQAQHYDAREIHI